MGGVVLGLRLDCFLVPCFSEPRSHFAYCFTHYLTHTLCIKGTDRLGPKAQPILVLLPEHLHACEIARLETLPDPASRELQRSHCTTCPGLAVQQNATERPLRACIDQQVWCRFVIRVRMSLALGQKKVPLNNPIRVLSSSISLKFAETGRTAPGDKGVVFRFLPSVSDGP
jgi:hypothetical protein